MKRVLILTVLIVCLTAFTIDNPLNQDPYNTTTSRDYAILSGLAFCPKDCVQGWSCGSAREVPMEEVKYVQHPITKAAGYAGYHAASDSIIVAFRGSDNIQNWIEDVNFEKVPYVYCLRCEIHSGFYADYLLLEPTINDYVRELLSSHPNAQIIATGHSLGAAISQIAALQLKMKFNRPTTIHNFGAPRLGNVDLARHINNRMQTVYRVVHDRDIVPHLPPDLPEFAYHHPAFQVFWNQEFTQYKVCSESGEDRSCSNKYFPQYKSSDHDFYFIHISQTKC